MAAHKDIIVDVKGTLGNFHLDAAFHVPGRGVTALFGPSGCGKTSILRAIAGLNRLEGCVTIGEQIWQGGDVFLPVYQRPIGYVFQEASLFAHLDVKQNLLFGAPRSARTKHSNIGADFDEVVTLLGLSHLVTRSPGNLSGGERQRVAIGRALLSHPQVLLMDEPLSALDYATREEIMPFIEQLRDQLNLPIFYITHDMGEVERLADQLVLLENGKVLAFGQLEDLQANPALPLAKARSAAVNLEADIKGWDEKTGLATLAVKGGQLLAPMSARLESHKMQGAHMRVRIAAGDVSLAVKKPEPSSILNILPARILTVSDVGPYEKLVSLALGNNRQTGDKANEGAHILCRLSAFSWEALGLYEGAQVYAQIKGVALISR